MHSRPDTYCGLYCGACPAYVATQEGHIAEQAAKWQARVDDVTCFGCKTTVVSKYCRSCEIKSCAQERGLESCAECDTFPCTLLISFRDDEWPHHSVITQNLEQIAKVGLEQWCAAQAIRWSCAACGQRTMWYDEQCSECDAKLVSSRDEDRHVHPVPPGES